MTAPDPKASGGEATAEDLAHKMYAVYFESLKGSTDDFSPKPGWYNGLPEKFSWLDHETEIAWYAAAKTALASLATKEADRERLLSLFAEECHRADCAEETQHALRIRAESAESENQSLRQRVEELSEQIHRLKPMADLNDMWKQELDDIGTIVGCDHHEGLASCVRQTLDKSEADLAAAQADSRRLREAYDELIYQVATKHEGESRHETAKRYIRERETVVASPDALSATVAAGKAEK